LVPPKNPEAMASAILRALVNRGLRETLRQNAYDHIRQFEWDKGIKRFEEVLASLLSASSERSSIRRLLPGNPEEELTKRETLFRKMFGRISDFDMRRKAETDHSDSFKENLIYKDYADYIAANFGMGARGYRLGLVCDNTLVSSLLAERGFKVKRINIQKKSLTLPQGKWISRTSGVSDVLDVTGQYDYVVASEIIEKLPHPDGFLEMFKNLFRIEALITTRKRDYYAQPSVHHFREYSIWEFESLLEKHFRDFRVGISGCHLYGWIKKELVNPKTPQV
jgi:hypothetical protein